MENKEKDNRMMDENNNQQNACPKKDKDGNCLVPGTYSDSDPIGGG